MNNFFACNSSDELAWKVIDLIYQLEDSDQKFYVFVADIKNPLWRRIPHNNNLKIIDESSVSSIPQIQRFYSLNNPYYNKTLISRLKPESVYFHNKELSKKDKILTEPEIYFLKFFNSEMNLFTFHNIVSLALKIPLKKEGSKHSTNNFSVIIEELSSNDEVFFWRKLITSMAKKVKTTLYTTKAIEEIFEGYGALPIESYKPLNSIDLAKNSHWVVRNSHWKYILNCNNCPSTVLFENQFNTQSATHGSALTYVNTDFSMQSFPVVQKYFENINTDKTIPGTHRWDSSIETWTKLDWATLEFDDLVFHMYYLYWTFYLTEKEIYLKNFEFGSSVNQSTLTQYMSSLVELHNLMENLQHLSKDKTEIGEFEKVLRHTNNSFIRVVNSDPLLAPLYTSFAVTNTASRDLTYEDIIRFYFKKADDIQLLTTVIFELLGSFSKQNKITINL